MNQIQVRPAQASDYAAWRPLWDGYNAFYGRSASTALPEHITAATWANFLDAQVPMQCHVALIDGHVQALMHLVFHHSTSREGPVCYLQDLFTAPEARGKGLARRLIESAYSIAAAKGCSRVYWTTQEHNTTARKLYDQMAEFKGFIVYS
jgi:GNAT superfamily N-acetyltransferase